MTTQLNVPGAGLHAVVIGVNRYLHLNNGGAAERVQYHGMNQLESPVPSALRLARWLMNGRVDASAPLRTLRVLVTNPERCAPDLLDADVPCVPPVFNNIRESVFDLMHKGNEDPENKLLFYFCGHGLSYSGTDTLLAEDFGSNEWDHFQHAINVDYLLGGMSNCKAQSQLYLFDACRTDGRVYPPAPAKFGDAIVNLERLESVDAKQVSLWASNVGNRAMGYRDGRPSVFAEAVLASLLGAAARKERNGYRISTSRLKEAIDAYVRERAPRARQVTDLRSTTLDFTIAELQNLPVVPVTVRCDDESIRGPAQFSYWSHPKRDGDAALDTRELADAPWHIDVAAGLYDFAAEFADADLRYMLSEEIAPPYAHVYF
ncbi:hypothetical protein HDG40_005653 [Paraburkholderia sp. JPY158]|uniref:Peptidase C14 caspase domain-containing protein n=1 Tax=Paraburkholderia atlantica TaxID=2654982 RepID=A0A7W8QC25_PARAM|nr:caspase family protein [Paraburkholderia atlantica]MBB5427474.1 hypothetical protein [Paraburkholderia atlantica]